MTSQRMTIGLDVTAAIVGSTGVSRYATSIWNCLLEDPEVEIKAFAAGRGRRLPHAALRLPIPLRSLHRMWSIARWPTAETLAGAIDLVHAMDLIPPPTHKPLVMTLQDAFAVTCPEFCAPRTRRLQERQLEFARHATVVVTSCEATADVLSEVVGIARERIKVSLLGKRPPLLFPNGSPPALHAGGYILAVGAITPRKAFDVLAEAARLVPECPPVLIAGPAGWQAEAVRHRVHEIGGSRSVSFLGDVDDATLDNLYRHATVVCHPSLAEGFGIGCLEAMGYGVPLVATDIPSTRELVAGTAMLVPPGDAEALADAIARLLIDSERRRMLGQLGLRRSAEYTWARTARSTVEAYRLALALG